MDTPEGMENTERLQDLVARMDGIEQRLGDGPSLQALLTGAPVLMKDLSADTRWPAFNAELTNRGFTCVLGVPLNLGTNASAALSFFAAAPRIFTEEIIKDAELFGQVAGRALRLGLRIAAAELHSEDLTAALDHRTAIDMARGIIMAQNRCTGEEAFNILRSVSSTRNEKLHDVAVQVVSSVSGTPGTAYFEP